MWVALSSYSVPHSLQASPLAAVVLVLFKVAWVMVGCRDDLDIRQLVGNNPITARSSRQTYPTILVGYELLLTIQYAPSRVRTALTVWSKILMSSASDH